MAWVPPETPLASIDLLCAINAVNWDGTSTQHYTISMFGCIDDFPTNKSAALNSEEESGAQRKYIFAMIA